MWEPNQYRQLGIYYYVAGFCLTPAFDLLWNVPGKSENGLYISFGIDPRMAVQKDLDYVDKIMYRTGRFEPFLSVESFPEIRYEGLTLGANYAVINRKLSLLAGPEITRIWNHNPDKLVKATSIGLNTEVRYLISRRFSVSYVGNLKSRPDISKEVVYSGYMFINFLLTANER